MFCRKVVCKNLGSGSSRDEFRAVCVPYEVKVMFVSIKLELLDSEPTIIPREVLCFCAFVFSVSVFVLVCVFSLLYCIDPVVYRGAS